jgi:hypothetical protein
MGEECDILFLISKWNEMPVILSLIEMGVIIITNQIRF